MNRDEQRQITALIEHAMTDKSGDGIDVEADAIIRALFVRNPEAAYRVTKLAVTQSQEIERLRALLAESSRMRRFGWLTRLFNPVAGTAGPAA